MNEDTLRKLFDANVIISNQHLDALISDTMSRYESGRRELTDEEAEGLAAAGLKRIVTISEKNPWD